MANIWEHPQIIAQEALTHLEDALVVTNMCAKDNTSEFTAKANGWKKGDTVSFRTHGDYVAEDFTGSINVQDIQTSSRAMQIEKHLDVSVEVTAREEVLDLDSFSDQVIRPAAYRLAEMTENYVASKILQGAGLYTSAGLFANAADIAQARKYATIQQLSTSRFCLVDLEKEADLLGQEWFNQSQTRGQAGERTLNTGEMGHVMGMDWYSAITFPQSTLTMGDGATTTDNTVATNNKIGLRVLTVAATTGDVVAGDRLAVAGCRRPLIAAAPAAAGSTSISIVDPITEIVADGAAVTTVASGATVDIHGAIFDDRSLAVAFPMLDMPGDKVTSTAANNGVSIRVVKGYDIQTKKTTMSLDLLCGAFAHDPRRITLVGETQ
ncbi:MAG: hypothetical protein DRQ46_08685 [Gammaproteobacteria bacterium]|nr:MAG: hypothetical protein DRQ46_08685 [Gammaproteobacteria bacterium]